MVSDTFELEIFFAERDDTLDEVEGGIEAKTVFVERKWWGLSEISVGIEFSSWKFSKGLSPNSQSNPNPT